MHAHANTQAHTWRASVVLSCAPSNRVDTTAWSANTMASPAHRNGKKEDGKYKDKGCKRGVRLRETGVKEGRSLKRQASLKQDRVAGDPNKRKKSRTHQARRWEA